MAEIKITQAMVERILTLLVSWNVIDANQRLIILGIIQEYQS